MNKTIPSLIILVFCFLSCNPYKPVVSSIKFQSKNCDILQHFINTHWVKHKNKLLYRYNKISKEEFVNEINTTYKECFFNLTSTEVKLLFGKPNEEVPDDALFYYMTEGCFDKVGPCDLLLISFNNSTLKPMLLMNQ